VWGTWKPKPGSKAKPATLPKAAAPAAKTN